MRQGTGTRCIVAVLFLIQVSRSAYAADVSAISGELGADMRWATKIAWWDVRSIVALPLEIGRLQEVSWQQLLAGIAAVGAIGVTIALDEDIRRGAKGIGSSTGRDIQDVATAVSWSTLGTLYGAGLLTEHEDWRHHALTGGEGAIASMGLTKASKAAFGRQRPDTGEGAYRWFAGGTSFVSDAATPHFSIAESVSESFDHAWWATLPSYAIATAVGVGRMGQDRHWASDIVGSAVLGLATEKLFSCFHEAKEREGKPVVSVLPKGDGVGLNVGLRF